MKTNPRLFGGERPQMVNPGFGPVALDLAHNYDARLVDANGEQLAALREGLGPRAGLMLDLNFSLKPVDVAIVDVPWNGLLESVKIANLAESYEINVAPHNFYGYLASFMSAHFCAAVPNFRIIEYEADDVPWKDDLVTVAPTIEKGEMLLPTAPGWGTEVNEEAVRAHPPKQPR